MKFGDREITFIMNIRATKEIAALCPGRDISKIDQLFDREDLVEFLDNLTKIAIAMSRNKQNEKPLTAEDIEELDITEMNELTQELRANFIRDKGTNVSVESIKKNEDEASESSSD